MSLIKCPECGKEISDQAPACVNCGYVFHKKKSDVKKFKNTGIVNKIILILLSLVTIVFIVVLIVVNTHTESNKHIEIQKSENVFNYEQTFKVLDSFDSNLIKQMLGEKYTRKNNSTGTYYDIYSSIIIDDILWDEAQIIYTTDDLCNQIYLAKKDIKSETIDELKQALESKYGKYILNTHPRTGNDIYTWILQEKYIELTPLETDNNYFDITLSSYNKSYNNKNHSKYTSDYLNDVKINFEINSAGGINFHFYAKNATNKRIKYIRFNVSFLNAVGDLVRDNITNQTSVEVEIIGPVEPYDSVSTDKIIGYCDTCDSLDIGTVTITYFDGTSDIIKRLYYS